ncbi:hypothetical protein WOSG25_050030 [Weissella oryzae SG25]|uniref:Nucleoid-associated protein n=1 Tax=Weissella oryzae (strain DSM 25784 / JCM 18191 / LMG 30913 / SG25) TaxID=1329250 RepID=A0A069D085_WEIOS|nr:nucleoid-associated protein [Weissella oryzae]GAK30731.1 hypothetical protein WOSG25_050030 [Weissella oryzae SG25]
MIIKHAILHVLNKDNGELIKSEQELEVNAGGIHEYLENFVSKFNSSDFKEGDVGNNKLLQQLVVLDNSESFIELTGHLAEDLFNAIATAEEVPSGDLLVIDYSEGANNYLAIFKLNFTRMYSQSINSTESGIANTLVRSYNILQPNSQQISDGLIIDKTHGTYWVTEGKYLIDGHRVNILSPLLDLKPKISARTQLKYLRQAVKKTADKYDIPEFKAFADVQNYLYENAQLVDSLEIDNVAKITFSENEAAQKDLIENLNKPEVGKFIDIPVGYEKKLDKRVFKLDSGIELSVPAELLKDDRLIQFINDSNGTSLINIKNINSIKTKFVN